MNASVAPLRRCVKYKIKFFDMKKINLFFFIILFSACKAMGQRVDTVTTVDYGKMPPIYSSNKVYWEKNYDQHNHLNFEALKYNTCLVGAFVNYWDNGIIKTKGNYVRNKTNDWTNLQSRGLCDVMDGIWYNYDESGKLTSKVTYDKGKLVKEEKF